MGQSLVLADKHRATSRDCHCGGFAFLEDETTSSTACWILRAMACLGGGSFARFMLYSALNERVAEVVQNRSVNVSPGGVTLHRDGLIPSGISRQCGTFRSVTSSIPHNTRTAWSSRPLARATRRR